MTSTNAIAALAANSGGSPERIRALDLRPDAAAPFSGLFHDAVGQMDTLEGEARSAVDGLMTGSGVDVHQAMIATQKVEMTFELALAIHNKAIQAYQSVMGMQF
jgi:flagellar hook-basal body complex protein FliE